MERSSARSVLARLLPVALLALAACQENSSKDLQAAGQVAPVAASFTASPTQGPVPLEVQFIDRSTGVIRRYAWDFGDGARSNEREPRHTYTKQGVFTVVLSLTGQAGESVLVAENLVVAHAPTPLPAFGVSVQEGVVPLTVQFSDMTQGEVLTRRWDFGDGTTSSEQNPLHVYQEPGQREVTLTVVGTGGSASSKGAQPIVARAPEPLAQFSADVTDDTVPFTTHFQNLSDAPFADGFTWHFGDGSAPLATATQEDVEHEYTTPGPRTVMLVADGGFGAGNDEEVKMSLVTARAPEPVAAFSATNTDGVVPLRVQFTNASVAPFNDGFSWDFGDGTVVDTLDASDMVHEYTVPGPYTVKLLAKGGFGAGDNLAEQPALVSARAPAPIAGFTTNPSPPAGRPPLAVQFIDSSLNAVDWEWDLDGDGAFETSGVPNPSFVYTDLGRSSPALRVIGGFGSTPDSVVADDLIDVFLPLEDGGFEASFAGMEPGSPWVSSAPTPGGGMVKVSTWVNSLLGPPAPALDLGDQFCELRDDFLFPPSFLSTRVSQTFSFRPNAPNLAFVAQLFHANSQKFSFLTVTLSDGASSKFLYQGSYFDIIGSVSGFGFTPLTPEIINIPTLFPGPDETTQFTIAAELYSIYQGGLESSRGYLDGFQLIPGDPPEVDFTATGPGGPCPCLGVAPFDVTFVGTSPVADPSTTWFWRFGDGGQGTGQMVTYRYTRGGLFDVSLTIRVPGLPEGTETKPMLIEALQRPTCSISAVSSANTGSIVSFLAIVSDDTPASQLSYSWDFGDNGANCSGASTQNASHVYQIASKSFFHAGPTYTVTLTVTDPDGFSCTDTHEIDIEPAVTWDTVWSTYLSGRCGSCHTTGTSGGLTGLGSQSTAYDNLVNKSGNCSRVHVLPASQCGEDAASSSFLFEKLRPSPSCGVRMPQGCTDCFDDTELASLRAWIDAGAPETVD